MKKKFLSFVLLTICFINYSQIYDFNSSINIDQLTEFNNREIYINKDSLNGDILGNGTISNPYQTIYKALEKINPIIDNCFMNFKISEGTYNLDSIRDKIKYFSFRGNSGFNFEGIIDTFSTNITLIQDSKIPTKYYYYNDTFSINELEGKFIFKSDDKLYPISSNDSTTLYIVENSLIGTYNIVELKTTFNNSVQDKYWLDFYANSSGLSTITFQRINLDWPYNRSRFEFGNLKINLIQCNYNFTIWNDFSSFNTNIKKYMNIRQSYNEINTSYLNNFRGNSYINLRENVFKSKIGQTDINVQRNPDFKFGGNILDSVSITLTNNTRLILSIENSFFNSKYAFKIKSGSTIHGNDYSTDLIFENIDYLISSDVGNSFYEFIKGGISNIYGQYNNLSYEKPGYKLLETNEINLPGLYPGISRGLSKILLDNSMTGIIIGDSLQNKSFTIEYTATRGNNIEKNEIEIINKKTSIQVYEKTLIGDDIGLSFNVQYHNGLIELLSTLTNTGINAEFEYNITRINY